MSNCLWIYLWMYNNKWYIYIYIVPTIILFHFSILVNSFISTHKSYFGFFFNFPPHPTGKEGSKWMTVWCWATCWFKPQQSSILYIHVNDKQLHLPNSQFIPNSQKKVDLTCLWVLCFPLLESWYSSLLSVMWNYFFFPCLEQPLTPGNLESCKAGGSKTTIHGCKMHVDGKKEAPDSRNAAATHAAILFCQHFPSPQYTLRETCTALRATADMVPRGL